VVRRNLSERLSHRLFQRLGGSRFEGAKNLFDLRPAWLDGIEVGRARPPELRREVLAVLKWKQAPYVKGRRPESKLRPISASNLEYAIARLYGFLVNILPHLPESASKVNTACIRTLPELVTPDSVSAFIDWLINVRRLSGRSVAAQLGVLCGALKEYYKDRDFAWLRDLIEGIPPTLSRSDGSGKNVSTSPTTLSLTSHAEFTRRGWKLRREGLKISPGLSTTNF
jgi:hypothetical protein